MSDANLLLGTTLRDVRVMRLVLRLLGPFDVPWAVRGLQVAIGLLGEVPDPTWFLAEPEYAKAGVLGTIFADPGRAGESLEALLRQTSEPAVDDVIGDALREVEAGQWLGAVR